MLGGLLDAQDLHRIVDLATTLPSAACSANLALLTSRISQRASIALAARPSRMRPVSCFEERITKQERHLGTPREMYVQERLQSLRLAASFCERGACNH